MAGNETPRRYIEIDRSTRIMNKLVAGLTKLGLRSKGLHLLIVRGRTSGELRSTPVGVLDHDGQRYLVAPRGETQWVRNLRAAGGGQLRLGRRTDRFTAVELPDDAKPAVLRPYLKVWKMDVAAFFDGVGADAPEDELRRIAPNHPVFRIATVH
ncbi:MAG TPA: nitroreductase family deazaflavin-dependent oxidoreductase [Pseudonocardiaceae bacterium]|jgi:deazaflavin-dependent oxidoreductase (nitroreductase family)|nr:nitroreductase family deazaflavin-dependent oxidoreductase [Pseudonocardiaceae bacterium]